MNSPKQILTVCALAAASTAAVASQTEVRLDVGEKASRCDWELLSYETVDGEKGRFAHVVATAEPGREVEIPLAAKGRHRIWIGAVAKRGGGYALHVRLGREEYPDRMQVDFKVPNVPPENPVIGELEFAVADLDGDTLVVRNVPGSPGGIAWVRLEPVAEQPAPKPEPDRPGDSGSSGKTDQSHDSTNTGDESNAVVWIALMAAAIVGAVGHLTSGVK